MTKSREYRISFKKLIKLLLLTCFTRKIKRLPRGVFWMLVALSIVPPFVAFYLVVTCLDDGALILGIILAFYIYFWVFYMRIRLEIARLHDNGKSGWNELCYVFAIFGFLICLLPEFLHRGDEEANSYGEPFDYSMIMVPKRTKMVREKAPIIHEHTAKQESLNQSEEYWSFTSFVYSKVKQTNIFKLWRKEQFDCQFGKCAICGKPMDRRYTQVDHIKPRYKHGTNYSNNLALTHKKCNENKGAKTGYTRPSWFKNNKYSEKLDEKVYELTEEIRKEYPAKFPDELFERP